MTLDKTGDVVSAQDYSPFGGIIRSYVTGGVENDKYKFTEKERDEETGNTTTGIAGYDYFGARYYDSELGRFLSTDPHSDSNPGLSPYVYCGNNPLIYIDPTGMDSTKSSTSDASKASTLVLVGQALEDATLTMAGAALSFLLWTSTTFSGDNAMYEENNNSDNNQEATESSNDGEKHKGFKEQAEQYKDKSVKKAERNLEKKINEHETKIKNDPNSKAVNHWKGEIKTWKEQLKIIKEIIKNRGL